MIFPLPLDHHFTPLQYNILYAYFKNALASRTCLLSLLPIVPRECSSMLQHDSPIHRLHCHSLRPTALLVNTPHAGCIDILPYSKCGTIPYHLVVHLMKMNCAGIWLEGCLMASMI
ncbi:hypothetical protein B0O99DRAFT_224321 [Bisporella sp. PMI_857]|nr:hypothetical protein B0O99DRAFT_224321 [Bisporella sp. PMI_857]